ncbi:AAA family ATPase [Halocatena marina]|uniref:AAA family ATPase n=1 Tax=Halocatena marina TaxID=2934937 RepID=UPI00200DA7DE|nr:AAA family ATPase [Halocatena marina]
MRWTNDSRQTRSVGVLLAVWIVGSVVLGFVLEIIFGYILPPSEAKGAAQLLGILLAGGLILLSPLYKRWKDKQRKRVQQLWEQKTPETAAEALSLIGRRDTQVRSTAMAVVAEVCRSAPGKIVKQSTDDAAQIVDQLVPHLTDSDRDTRIHAAVALKFFTRDYPDTVIEHTDTMREVLNGADSPVQISVALAVGNFVAAHPDHGEKFDDQIAQLLSDEDPEVRSAACIALGHFPPDQASEQLQEMTDDSSPLVARSASAALSMLQGDSEPANQIFEGITGVQRRSSTEFVDDSPDRDFNDVAGMDSLKNRLREQIIEPFHGSDVYEKYGVASDSGILFYGPPGTGKTHIATCLAGELSCNYISVDVGSIESRWVGESSNNIKQLFDEAHRSQPCLVFIDEIDALATDRSESNQTADKKKMVNQLLQEMSTIDDSDDIIVIGATNNPDDVDDAMLRTGRFDSKIHVPKPDAEARLAIFEQYMNAPTEAIDPDEFKRATRGLVASDMVAIARRAGVQAATREQKTGRESIVTETDVLNAVDEITTEQGGVGEFIQQPPEMDFSDVIGAKKLKSELQQTIIDPLTNPEFHEEYGLGVENGVLLYGPPGTGKTYIATCLAGELGCSFISARAGDLVSKWVGQGAKNVQTMFEEARSNQPCIIFIDEIDALVTDRSANQTKSERQMVNQFLTELSHLSDDNEDVVVIGATNRPDEIDSAMLRTGRFSEKIRVGPPDTNARIALFDSYLVAPVNDISPQAIGEMTEGFVASDMKHVAERAARKAMKRAKNGTGPKEVTQADVSEAVSEVRRGKRTGRG